MRFQPTFAKILIRISGLETDSSLVLPQGVVPPQPYGNVLAVGPLCQHTQIGDKVLFTPASALSIDLAGVEHYIIDEGSIFGKYLPNNPIDIAG